MDTTAAPPPQQSFEECDFWVDLSNIKMGPEIGSGMFSKVYLGDYFGDLVAVKKQTRDSEKLEDYLFRELAVLKSAHHPNLMAYFGACNEVNPGGQSHALYIVTEFCQNGDLLSLILSKYELGWKFRLKIAHECSQALLYLHEHNFVHRDVKSSNILLDHNWTCKVSDFGMSREVSEYVPTMRMTICGTEDYMAPELMFDEEYSVSIDTYAFGMVLLEILRREKVGRNGFAVRRPQSKFKIDLDEVQGCIPSDAPPSLLVLARECLNYEAAARPSMQDVKEWLSDLHASTPESGVPLPPLQPIDDAFRRPADVPAGADSSAKLSDRGSTATSGQEHNSSFSGDGKERGHIAAALNFLKSPNIFSSVLHKERDKESAVQQQSVNHASKLWRQYGLDCENAFAESKVVISGYLYKKAYEGFRNWKKVVVTISKNKMWWRTGDKSSVKFITINADTAVTSHDNLRFSVSYSLSGKKTMRDSEELVFSKRTEGWGADLKFTREFYAETALQKLKWVDALQDTISKQQALGDEEATACAAPVGERLDFDSIELWLDSLGLRREYASQFHEAGFTIEMVNNLGLSEGDVEAVGIASAAHRKAILAAAGEGFSSGIRVAIPRWRDFGSVIVYCVVCRWRFNRSAVALRYSDFKGLDSFLRRELRDCSMPAELAGMPSLPEQAAIGQLLGNNKDPAFLAQRMAGLELYLLQLCRLLHDKEPLFLHLLNFLNLYRINTVSETEFE